MLILIAVIVIELIDFGFLFVISVLLRQMSGNPAVNELVKIGAIMLAIFILKGQSTSIVGSVESPGSPQR